MVFDHPFYVIGYHGCDREVGLRIINGQDRLRHSINPWNWLGDGIYFFEDNPERALLYARDCADKRQKFNGEIRNPFVIGALILLGNCFDLSKQKNLNVLKEEYAEVIGVLTGRGAPIPENKGANRRLDCTIFNQLHESNRMKGLAPYDTIRSPFNEGAPIFDQTNFTMSQHLQICVRNPDQILHYFLPQPIQELNPWLERDYAGR